MSKQDPKQNYDLYSLARSSVVQLKKTQQQLQAIKEKISKLTDSAIDSDCLDQLESVVSTSVFDKSLNRSSSRERLAQEIINEIDTHCRSTDILIKRFEQLRDQNYTFGNAVYDRCSIS